METILKLPCLKYVITNDQSKTIFINYRDCETTQLYQQVEILPGETRTYWALSETLESNVPLSILEVTESDFPVPNEQQEKFFFPVLVFTGITFNESVSAWETNDLSKSITLYLGSNANNSGNGYPLYLWINGSVQQGERKFYSDSAGTQFTYNIYPPTPANLAIPRGLYFTHLGWVNQIGDSSSRNTNFVYNPQQGSFQTARQAIPVWTASTLSEICFGTKNSAYMVVDNPPTQSQVNIMRLNNFPELSSGSNVVRSLEYSPYYLLSWQNNLTYSYYQSIFIQLKTNWWYYDRQIIAGTPQYVLISNFTNNQGYGEGSIFSVGSSGVVSSIQLCPSPTPTPTITPTITPTQSITPTITPSITVTPTVTASITPTITPTPSVTTSPGTSPSPTPTFTSTPTLTTSITSTKTPTNSVTVTRTITPTITPTNTTSPTKTITPTITPTHSSTPTNTVTHTITSTSTITPTETLTPTTSLTPGLSPSITPTITPTETITPTITPTTSVTPTLTPSPTSTPLPCTGCTNYTVVITQEDLNESPDGKIYVEYYTCGSNDLQGGKTFSQYAYSGTYLSDICVQSCSGVTMCYYGYNGNTGCTTPNLGSQIINTYEDCVSLTYSCSTCFDLTISEPGYTTFYEIVELGQTYGNLEVTISATNATDIFEVFVGYLQSNFGEVFQFTSPNQSITKNVGYFSYGAGSAVDLSVYASTTSSFQPVSLNVCIGCPTLHPCNETPQIYINGCVTDPANGSGQVTLTVVSQTGTTFDSGNFVNVETGVTINYAIIASLNTVSGTITIPEGSNCATETVGGFTPNDFIDGLVIVSVSPNSSTNQVYNPGNGFRDTFLLENCYSC